MSKKRIGIRQLKNEAPRVLSEIREDGAEYLVTRHGKPVALITPISQDELEPDQEDKVTVALIKLQRTAKIVAEAAAHITAPTIVSRQRR